MEGLGYDNWGDESGYDTSTPPTYTSETYGFGAGSKKSSSSGIPATGIASGKSRSDIYDFDITNDDLSFGKRDSGAPAASKKKDFAPRQTRRLSTADRADEILRNSINERKSIARDQPAEDAFSSFQESWKELMVGLETHSKETTPVQTPSGSPRFADKMALDGPTRLETSSPFESPGSESFEISAADLEVGAIARRSKEKAMERRRGRLSFDHMPTRGANSPDTTRTYRANSADFEDTVLRGSTTNRAGGVMSSAALSSIDKADAIRLGGSDGKVYGGVDKSDGDLFRLLTENKAKSGRYGSPSGQLNRAKSNSFDISDGISISPTRPPINIGKGPSTPGQSDGNGSRLDEDNYSDEEFDESMIENLPKKPIPKAATERSVILGAPKAMTESAEDAFVRMAAATSLALAEEKEKANQAPAPALSKAELDRRKSIELIQQRWFSKSPPVSTSTEASNAPEKDDNVSVSQSIPLASALTTAASSGIPIRPSPLVASQSERFSPRLEKQDTLQTVEKVIEPEIIAAEDTLIGRTRGDSLAYSEKSTSDPPSPPSSAAISLEYVGSVVEVSEQTEQKEPEPKITNGGAFKSISLASSANFVGKSEEIPNENVHPLKSRVSFDLERNTLHKFDGNSTNKPVAMSVDSLDGLSTADVHSKSVQETSLSTSSGNRAPIVSIRYDSEDSYDHNAIEEPEIKPLHRSEFDKGYRRQSSSENISAVQDNGRDKLFNVQSDQRNCNKSYDDNKSKSQEATENSIGYQYSYLDNNQHHDIYTASTTSRSTRQPGVIDKGSVDSGQRVAKSIPELTLDVVVPSVDDLHAQLAMIKAAERRRRENRVDRSADRGSWDQSTHLSNQKIIEKKSLPVSKTKKVAVGSVLSRNDVDNAMRSQSRSPPPPPAPSAAPEWDSLSRLEQSNARLNRQFEDLNKEIQQLRSSATRTTPPRAPLQNRLNQQFQRLKRNDLDSENSTVALKSTSDSAAIKSKIDERIQTLNGWDSDVLFAVKDILRESEDLNKKERKLMEREKVLNIRENLVNQTVAEKMKEKSLEEQEKANNEELVNLKSQLFKAQQHIYQLHVAAKTALGLQPDIQVDGDANDGFDKPQWDSTHYFERTCSYLNRLKKDPQAFYTPAGNNSGQNRRKDKDSNKHKTESADGEFSERDSAGGRWIDGEYYISNERYIQLQKDKIATDALLEASQKENERLMGLIKGQERDMKTKDATFFDQQAAMVKEINRLKNHLERYAGQNIAEGDTTGNSGFQSNAASNGIGSKRLGPGIVTDSVPTGRAALEAEAIIWRQTEQLAEAEANFAEREHKLQQTIGRLKLEIQSLKSDTISIAQQARTADLQRTAASKSVHDRAFFSSQLVGASATLNKEDTDPAVPPPPPLGTSLLDVSPQNMAISELQMALKEERAQSAEEISNLRSRLAWYAETQQLVDELLNERAGLKNQLKELKTGSRGLQSPGDISFQSSAGGASRRNVNDVKKIRELEQTCEDLRDALKKRYPDSIANLINATAAAGIGADPNELSRLRKENASLKVELSDLQVESDRKLRGLRQEYERMRILFEERVRVLESNQPVNDTEFEEDGPRNKRLPNPAVIARRAIIDNSKPWSGNKLNPTKNLSQALGKIREMEINESRLRGFYTRKIEQLQHRYENQIQAYKRGGAISGAINLLPSAYHASKEAISNNRENSSVEEDSVSEVDSSYLAVAEKRVELLQEELMRTAEELGRAKQTITALETELKNTRENVASSAKEIASQTTILQTSSNTAGAPSHNNTTELVDRIISQQQHISLLQGKLDAEIQKNAKLVLSISYAAPEPQIVVPSTQPVTVHRQNLPDNITEVSLPFSRPDDQLVRGLEDKVCSLQQRLDESTQSLLKESTAFISARSDWANTQSRLMDNINALQNENMQQREQLRVLQNTPQMSNFLTLESQLKGLEMKLNRREIELRNAVEDGKKAMQMDRLRLQALHEQELREKDEQLNRFQLELEQLVIALKSNVSPAANNADKDKSINKRGSINDRSDLLTGDSEAFIEQ